MHSFKLFSGSPRSLSERYFNIRTLKSVTWVVFRTLLIIGLSFMVLFPLFTKIVRSFMTWEDMTDPTVYYIPRSFTFENFQYTWSALQYPLTLLKSTAIALLVAVLQTVACTAIAYGLARFKFRGQKLLFALVMLTFLVPPQVILMPLYLKFRYFNPLQLIIGQGLMSGVSLLNTIWPMVILALTGLAFKSGLYIYLLRQYFTNLPMALDEAAYIDGCGNLRIFTRIMLPNALPMVATCFLFSFVWQWNDYYYTSMLAPELPTLPMKIMELQRNLESAGASELSILSQGPAFLLLIIPLIVLYLFTQRTFVESVTRSGIVG